MFTPTIYIPDCNLEAELISLDELKLHHLKNVLRIKNEDNVNISTGKGKLLIGNLSNNNVKVSSKMNYLRNHEITIFIPALREKNRFRFMIEKLVELNVSKVVIGKTENTQNTRIDIDRINNWAISAVEQSGTPFFPEIEVIDEIMQTDVLDHLSIEDQMMVLYLIADSMRRYKGKETSKFLNELDDHFKIRKNLSDL